MGYPKELYDRVKSQFDAHRFDARNERELRKKEVYRKIPMIAELDKESAKIGLSLVGDALMGEKERESFYQKQERAMEIISQRRILLKEAGFKEDYLDIHYKCDKCQDTGVTEKGYCDCFNDKLTKLALKEANLPILTDDFSFDTFSMEVYPEEFQQEMETVFRICKDYAENFESETGENIYMYGAPGLGKTFISSCIAKRVVQRGFSVFYQPAYKIFRIYEDYKFNSDNKELNKAHIDKITSCDLLILDDLGAEMATTYTAEVLFDLINTRINNKQATIISTNLDFPELETIYSERICSRILGNYQILGFAGEDVRNLDV